MVRGRATFTLDGAEHDAPAGTLVFAGDPAAPYAVAPWETWFLAEARSLAGDHQAALAIMAGARETHAGDAAFHHNHACSLTRAGRLDDAAAELRAAARADGERIARWADGDPDLDPLRGRADWPLA